MRTHAYAVTSVPSNASIFEPSNAHTPAFIPRPSSALSPAISPALNDAPSTTPSHAPSAACQDVVETTLKVDPGYSSSVILLRI